MTATFDVEAIRAHWKSVWENVDPNAPSTYDGGFIGPELDLHVSESDARRMQRAHDSRLTQMWGPQV